MAYFEVDVLGGGNTRVDRAILIDSDQWMVPADPGGTGISVSVDIFVWNATDTPVDVYLLGGHADLRFAKDLEHYQDAQIESNVRSVTTAVFPGVGPTLDIRGLAPGEFFPVVISNPTNTNAQRWLDADSCTMSTAGHGTNIFNGQRVYVLGHRA